MEAAIRWDQQAVRGAVRQVIRTVQGATGAFAPWLLAAPAVYAVLGGAPAQAWDASRRGTAALLEPDGPGVVLLYGFGLAALLFVLYLAAAHGSAPGRIPEFRLLLGASLLVGTLYAGDCLISTAAAFRFADRLWIFFPLIALYLTAFFLNSGRSRCLVEIVCIALGIECGWAVIGYFSGVGRFHTPYFGDRAGGSFADPEALYPLCLFAIGLGAGLALTPGDRLIRGLFAASAVSGGAALFLTFTRSGWLGLAAMVTFAALWAGNQRSGALSTPRTAWRFRIGLLAVSLMVLAGVFLVRTGGRPIGSARDRSFWGRLAIWRTAAGIVADRPWFGHGMFTYGALQSSRSRLDPGLLHFRPENNDAKNLYLNLGCEFGCAGLAVWGAFAWAFHRVQRLPASPHSPPAPFLTAGIHASLVGLGIASLFDTPVLVVDREAPTWVLFLLLGAAISLKLTPARHIGRGEQPTTSLPWKAWVSAACAALLAGGALVTWRWAAACRMVPRGIVLHHSAPDLPDAAQVDAEALGRVAAGKGLGALFGGKVYDIGYHYVILPDGTVQGGRPAGCRGAHALGYSDHLGICLAGDFDLAAPTREQLGALEGLLRRLMKQYTLAPETIRLHHDATVLGQCPGYRFSLDQVLREVGRSPGPGRERSAALSPRSSQFDSRRGGR